MPGVSSRPCMARFLERAGVELPILQAGMGGGLSGHRLAAAGSEAGGHGGVTIGALDLLSRVRDTLPPDYPVLSAGGVAEPGDVRARLDAGAEAVICGTRFLMTDESGAHPAYQQRLIGARETI